MRFLTEMTKALKKFVRYAQKNYASGVRGRLSGIEPTSKIVGLLLPIGAVKAQPALGKGDKAGVVHGRERGTGGDAHVLRDGEGDTAPMARSFAVSWELQKPDSTSTVIPGCMARKLLRMPGIWGCRAERS